MTKSKKHSPQQSETESILSQVPQDKMALFVQELRELMRQKKQAPSDKTNSTSEEQVIMDEAGASLEPWMSRP